MFNYDCYIDYNGNDWWNNRNKYKKIDKEHYKINIKWLIFFIKWDKI